MAIPKRLRPITKESAARIIAKHVLDGTGEWEGAPYSSDFVYRTNTSRGPRYKMIRSLFGRFETGMVSL